MADQREKAVAYARQHGAEFLNNLKELVHIPSVSTDYAHIPDMKRAAEWLSAHLTGLGMQNAQIFETKGHPIVYAEWLGAGKDAPTVLIYGHYDVQPVDPIDLWDTPPFEPTLRGDNLYSRGVSDMKGQIIASLAAVESIVKNGGLPVNIKWLIEGEEEIGSPNLPEFIASHQKLLACDFCLNPDSGMIGKDKPTITYALRGLAYFELRIDGPDHDLHSGISGGVVQNPANVLAKLVAGMHDDQGRIQLPGFYDAVRELSQEERAELARLPLDDAYYLKQTGAPALFGEAGYSSVERAGARPTLDVNGILSGFTGQGAKTVLPAWAMAKISMRLVPDQDPETVKTQLQQYLEAKTPKTVRFQLEAMHGGKPSISATDTAYVKALAAALQSAWGTRPYFKREGGSVPVVGVMQELLGVDSVLTGFGLPDDNLHAPNEKLTLPVWHKGIEALVHFFYELA